MVNSALIFSKLRSLDLILKENVINIQQDIAHEESNIDFLQDLLTSVKIRIRKEKMEEKFSRKMSQVRDRSIISHKRIMLAKRMECGRGLTNTNSANIYRTAAKCSDPKIAVQSPTKHNSTQIFEKLRSSELERMALVTPKTKLEGNPWINRDSTMFKSFERLTTPKVPPLQIKESLNVSRLSSFDKSIHIRARFNNRASLRMDDRRKEKKENIANISAREGMATERSTIHNSSRMQNQSIMSSFFDKF